MANLKTMAKLLNRWLTILTVIIFWLTSCKSVIQPEAAGKEENLPPDIVELRDDQIRLASIELGKVEMQKIGESIKVNGRVSVAPSNIATVCMPFGGFIKYTDLMPGVMVHKGETLAIIENQDFVDIEQNYLEAKNKLAFAEADYKRHSELYESDIYSEQNVQEVTVGYRNLKALVRSLEQKLLLIGVKPSDLTEENISSSVNLTSPINGFIRSVNINIGKYVSPTDILFEVVNNDHLYLELSLFEKDADRITTGQEVSFYINNEDEEHVARVSQTGKSMGNDNAFTIYAKVESQCSNVLPGMYVNAVIKESKASVTALPSEAVVTFDDKDYIFLYEKEKTEAGNPFTEYRILEVRKGVSSGGYTQILLPEDFDIIKTRVVTRGAYNLLSAMKNAGEMAC